MSNLPPSEQALDLRAASPDPPSASMEMKMIAQCRAAITLEQELETSHAARTRESQNYANLCGEIMNAAGSDGPDTAVGAITKLRAQRDAAVALLRKLEWSGGTIPRCPDCRGLRNDHSEDCRLAALLKGEKP